jgi:hypothetical protein
MKVTITIMITLTLSTATALTAATVKEEGTPIAINKQQPTAMITTPPEEATETPRRPTHHLITTPPEEATETSRRPTHHHYSPSKHTIAPTRLVQCTKSLVMSREQKKCTLLRQNQFPKDFKKLPKNQSINYNA